MVLATFGKGNKVSKAVCIDGLALQHLTNVTEEDVTWAIHCQKTMLSFKKVKLQPLQSQCDYNRHFVMSPPAVGKLTHCTSSSPLHLGYGPPR